MTESSQTTGVPRRTTLTLERSRLYEQIATLTAGNPAGDVYAALADNQTTRSGHGCFITRA